MVLKVRDILRSLISGKDLRELERPGVSDGPEGSEGQRVERSRRSGRFGR